MTALTGVTTCRSLLSSSDRVLDMTKLLAKRENGTVLLSIGDESVVVMPERNWDRLVAALKTDRP